MQAHKLPAMKTANLPVLRVSPELRMTAEAALRPNETLSKLMEQSLEQFIAHRRADDDFLARGLRAAAKTRKSGRYVSAAAVLGGLEGKLAAARKGQARSARRSI